MVKNKVDKNFHIWEGIYQSFKDCPKVGQGYNNEIWIEKSKKKISDGDSLLPFLVSLLYNNKRIVNILDFGGGLGFHYLQTLSCLPENPNLNYLVVDLPKVCKEGRKFFPSDPKIKFSEVLPSKKETFDLVYIGSSLQYVDKWQQLLKSLTDYQPSHILFVDLPAGSISTFVTRQNYYDSKIPYRFYNIDEVINVMKKLKYSLKFRSLFNSQIFGQFKEYPMDNFSLKYRLGKSCNLLFKNEIKNRSGKI